MTKITLEGFKGKGRGVAVVTTCGGSIPFRQSDDFLALVMAMNDAGRAHPDETVGAALERCIVNKIQLDLPEEYITRPKND